MPHPVNIYTYTNTYTYTYIRLNNFNNFICLKYKVDELAIYQYQIIKFFFKGKYLIRK